MLIFLSLPFQLGSAHSGTWVKRGIHDQQPWLSFQALMLIVEVLLLWKKLCHTALLALERTHRYVSELLLLLLFLCCHSLDNMNFEIFLWRNCCEYSIFFNRIMFVLQKGSNWWFFWDFSGKNRGVANISGSETLYEQYQTIDSWNLLCKNTNHCYLHERTYPDDFWARKNGSDK